MLRLAWPTWWNGRHRRLKISRLYRPCRFESGRGYQAKADFSDAAYSTVDFTSKKLVAKRFVSIAPAAPISRYYERVIEKTAPSCLVIIWASGLAQADDDIDLGNFRAFWRCRKAADFQLFR